jgi:hypothetical protein
MKSRSRVPAVVAACAVMLVCMISEAATDSKTLLVKTTIGKSAKVVVDTNSISFPDVGADQTDQIPATQNDVRIIVKARTDRGSPVTLNVVADGDLLSGADSIPIQNVTWQASGAGFQGGVLSKAKNQTAGSWTGSGIREGRFRYFLKNSWNYQKGEYQATLTYTLTVP